jgi:hypothetical protein
MSLIPYLTGERARQSPQLIFVLVLGLIAMFVQAMSAQCVKDPEKRTALRFNNETSLELTFFVDDDEEGVGVASRAVSRDLEVEPGEHLLRARAVIRGESFFVWVVNEVPLGQVCTWTITDPTARAAVVSHNIEMRLVWAEPQECQDQGAMRSFSRYR